jgi:CheY-like chemotaxis protein
MLIAVTGYGQQEHRRQTQQAGFDLYLVKRVDPNTLQEILARPETTANFIWPRAGAPTKHLVPY